MCLFVRTADKAKASGGSGPESVRIEQEEVSNEQQSRLAQIEMRDMRQDELIGTIGDGVDRLDAMARAMGEEVETQGHMLKALDEDLGKAQEHVEKVNENLKEILKQVRGADRFCMDIFCVLLLLGMLGVFLQIQKNNNADDDADDDK